MFILARRALLHYPGVSPPPQPEGGYSSKTSYEVWFGMAESFAFCGGRTRVAATPIPFPGSCLIPPYKFNTLSLTKGDCSWLRFSPVWGVILQLDLTTYPSGT